MNIFKPLSPEQLRNRELTPIEQERLQLIDISFDRLASAARQQFGVELQQPITTVNDTAERTGASSIDSVEQQQPPTDEANLTDFSEATVRQLQEYVDSKAVSAQSFLTDEHFHQDNSSAGGEYDKKAA